MTAHLIRCRTFLSLTWSRHRRDGERGSSLVEYALLMALIVLVCFGAVTFFGQATSSKASIQACSFEGTC